MLLILLLIAAFQDYVDQVLVAVVQKISTLYVLPAKNVKLLTSKISCHR